MIKPDEVSEAVWRAGMSAYHKTLRKNPALAWQTAAAEILNEWWCEVQMWQLNKNRHNGYAPGLYSCMCKDCGKPFMGDKRAYQCAPCAGVPEVSPATQEPTP